MLQIVAPSYARARDIVNGFRIAVLATIAFLALLMVAVAISAAIWDVSERAMTVISVAMTALTGLAGTVVVYLKVDSIEAKTDHAARRASVAADRAAIVEKKVEHVQEFVANGGLRDNVRRALTEERHMLQNRETAESLKQQLEERLGRRGERTAEPSDA